MTKFRHSIRWRLQAWHGLLLLVVLCAFGFWAHRLMTNLRMRDADQELHARATILVGAARPLPPGSAFRDAGSGWDFLLTPDQEDLFSDVEGLGYYYMAWSPDGAIAESSAGAPVDIPLPGPEQSSGVAVVRQREHRRELAMVVQPPAPPSMPGRTLRQPQYYFLVVGCSVAPELEDLEELAWLLAGVGGGVWVAGLLVGGWFTHRAIRPIRDIGATAARIAAGSYSERIDVREASGELGRLAAELNETFARLQVTLERQARFAADASHELRTPTFVILAQAQSALRKERTQAEYRAGFEVCERAAQRIRHLIDSLLSLARYDAAVVPLARTRLQLDKAVEEAIAEVAVLASEAGVAVRSELAEISIEADAQQVRSLLSNLLANAIGYNRTGGTVVLSLRCDGGMAVLKVADTGRGIPADQLPHIFERFYRVDPTRSSGNSGLGLAICQAVVEEHRGSIAVESEPGIGTTFTIRLPLISSPVPAGATPAGVSA